MSLWKGERRQGLWASKPWLSAQPIGSTDATGKQCFDETQGWGVDKNGEASSQPDPNSVEGAGEEAAVEAAEKSKQSEAPALKSSRQLYMEHLVLLEREKHTLAEIAFESQIPRQEAFPQLNNTIRAVQDCEVPFVRPVPRANGSRALGGQAGVAEYRF